MGTNLNQNTEGAMQKCYTNGGRKTDWVWYCDGTKKVTKELETSRAMLGIVCGELRIISRV